MAYPPAHREAFISRKEFVNSFCKRQFSHKSVDVSVILETIKDQLTDLCGNRLSQNDSINTFREINGTGLVGNGGAFEDGHVCEISLPPEEVAGEGGDGLEVEAAVRGKGVQGPVQRVHRHCWQRVVHLLEQVCCRVQKDVGHTQLELGGWGLGVCVWGLRIRV